MLAICFLPNKYFYQQKESSPSIFGQEEKYIPLWFHNFMNSFVFPLLKFIQIITKIRSPLLNLIKKMVFSQPWQFICHFSTTPSNILNFVSSQYHKQTPIYFLHQVTPNKSHRHPSRPLSTSNQTIFLEFRKKDFSIFPISTKVHEFVWNRGEGSTALEGIIIFLNKYHAIIPWKFLNWGEEMSIDVWRTNAWNSGSLNARGFAHYLWKVRFEHHVWKLV